MSSNAGWTPPAQLPIVKSEPTAVAAAQPDYSLWTPVYFLAWLAVLYYAVNVVDYYLYAIFGRQILFGRWQSNEYRYRRALIQNADGTLTSKVLSALDPYFPYN